MKTVILYTSNYDYTKAMAERIALGRSEHTQCINLDQDKLPDFADIDTIVLGSSIYVGQIHKSMKTFIDKHHAMLLSKSLIIYLCCAFEHEFENHLSNNFPEVLLAHASLITNLGGQIDKSKLNFGHKLLVTMIEKTDAGKKPILRHDERIDEVLRVLSA